MCDQHVSKTWTTSLEVFQEELVLGYWDLSLTWFPVAVFKIFRSSRKKKSRYQGPCLCCCYSLRYHQHPGEQISK